jgi:hypothetical protein
MFGALAAVAGDRQRVDVGAEVRGDIAQGDRATHVGDVD